MYADRMSFMGWQFDIELLPGNVLVYRAVDPQTPFEVIKEMQESLRLTKKRMLETAAFYASHSGENDALYKGKSILYSPKLSQYLSDPPIMTPPPAYPPEPPAPDFDGEDVYDADEVDCPHCGHKLRVIMRARLSVAEE